VEPDQDGKSAGQPIAGWMLWRRNARCMGNFIRELKRQ
jgi:hypothetical protein